jgi:hypothetical protein
MVLQNASARLVSWATSAAYYVLATMKIISVLVMVNALWMTSSSPSVNAAKASWVTCVSMSARVATRMPAVAMERASCRKQIPRSSETNKPSAIVQQVSKASLATKNVPRAKMGSHVEDMELAF